MLFRFHRPWLRRYAHGEKRVENRAFSDPCRDLTANECDASRRSTRGRPAGGSPMTIPRTVDDLTPEWCSDALRRPITSVLPTPLGVGVGLVGQLYKLELDGRRRAATTVIAKLAAPDRREPFRRDGPQHVRPRGRLLQRVLEAHEHRASGVSLRGARSRDAGHGVAARRRVAARPAARSDQRVHGRRRAPGDPIAREVARVLLGRSVARRAPTF